MAGKKFQAVGKVFVNKEGKGYDTENQKFKRGRKALRIIEWDYPNEENKVMANTFIKDEFMMDDDNKNKR